MTRWIKHIILWALMAAFTPAMAGAGTVSPVAAEDTAYVLRQPGEEFLERFRDDPDFQYGEKGVEEVSLWQRLLAWLREHFFSCSTEEAFNRAMEYVLWGMAAVVFGILVYLFVRHKGWRAFRWKPKEEAFAEAGADLASAGEGGYERLLREALEGEDYVMAVRLRFAAVLRLLDGRGIVHRRAGKTNREYGNEIADEGLRRRFGRLCWVFDRVTYGEFPFGAEAYRQAEREFDDFEKEVGR